MSNAANQEALLLDAVKRLLKAKGITYRALAAKLNVSEPSVKRMFSLGRVTLGRLTEICALLDTTFLEVAKLARYDDPQRAVFLSFDQEQALAASARMLAVFYLLLRQWRVCDIAKTYQISEREMQRHLLGLDRLNLIEYHPGDHVKLRVSRTIKWHPEGPLRRELDGRMRAEFLAGGFKERGERSRFLVGELSATSQAVIARRIDSLEREFNELAAFDARLDKSQTRGVGLLLAARPWVFSLLSELKTQSESV